MQSKYPSVVAPQAVVCRWIYDRVGALVSADYACGCGYYNEITGAHAVKVSSGYVDCVAMSAVRLKCRALPMAVGRAVRCRAGCCTQRVLMLPSADPTIIVAMSNTTGRASLPKRRDAGSVRSWRGDS